MEKTYNEEAQYEIMQNVSDALHEIIRVEGRIKKSVKYGNSTMIYFENGNVYKQPHANKYTTKLTHG